MLAAVFLLVSAVAATQPPDSSIDTTTALRPTRYELDLRVDVAQKRVDGEARITVINRGGRPVRFAPFLLYRLMHVGEVREARGGALAYQDRIIEFLDHPTWQARQIIVELPRPLADGDSVTLRVAYGGYMVGYSETGWSYLHDQIDSAYSLLRMDTYAYPELRPPSHTLARRTVLPEKRLSEIAPRDYGRVLMTDNAYSVGAVMFYVMYRVMGHEAFSRLVRDYYSTYATTGATTDQLIAMAKRDSPVPLDALFADWLNSPRWTTAIATTNAAALPARYSRTDRR